MNLFERIRLASSALFGRSSVHSQFITDYMTKVGVSNEDPEGAFQRAYRTVQWVYICTFAITSFAAMCPIKLYRRMPGMSRNDWKELDPKHPAYEILRHPNPNSVLYTFIERLVGFMELGGNGFIFKDDMNEEAGKYDGPPKRIWAIRPDWVKKVIPDEHGVVRGFEIGMGGSAGKGAFYPASQVVWVPYFNPYNDYWGQGSLQAIQRTVISDVQLQDYRKSYMANQAIPATLLVSKSRIPDAQRKLFLQTFEKMHKGPSNAGRTGLVDGDIAVHQLASKISELDVPGLRTMDRDEIIAAFGCFKGQFGLDVANRSVIESHERQFAQKTMIPKLTYIAQCLTEGVFKDYDADIEAEFDLSAVPALQDDEDAKATRAVSIVNAGIRTINEVRRDDYGDPPVPWGDTWHLPMTMVPVESAGGLFMPKPPDEGQKSRAMPEYTLAQEKRVLMYERIFKAGEKKATRLFRELFDRQAEHAKAQVARARQVRDIDDIIDEAFLETSTTETVRQVLIAALEQGILHGKEPLDFLNIEFTLDNPKLLKWLETESMKQVKLVNGTTLEMLKEAQKNMAAMIEAGEPMSNVVKVIDYAFEGRKNNAATIARTEVQQGIQTGQDTLWAETPVVEGKTWLASFHPEGRHNEMHGQTVPMDGLFVNPNSGANATHPGGFGIAGEDINCLCDMAPAVNAKALKELKWRQVNDGCSKIESWYYPAKGKGSQSWEKNPRLRQLAAKE